MDIKIIGLGGIGSDLSDKISRFLNYGTYIKEQIDVCLIDGDSYETKNFERQCFLTLGNKAEIKELELTNRFKNIRYSSYPHFIDENNIENIIKNGDVVFICVDNHKTRNIINSYCKTLSDVVIISGGNELTDGTVQLYIRKGGEDITPPLDAFDEGIRNPTDKLPTEMSCEELHSVSPQIFFTNVYASTIMASVFYSNIVMAPNEYPSVIYFDILKNTARPSIRK